MIDAKNNKANKLARKGISSKLVVASDMLGHRMQ